MKHFSSYLLDQNLLTANQLQSCIAAQAINSHVIGHYAVKKGFISDSVRRQIQHQNWLSINQTGSRLSQFDGLLSENQLFELLKYQAFNHNCLGLTLVKLGYMTVNSLKAHLGRFREMIIGTNDFHAADYCRYHRIGMIHKEVVNRHRSFLFNTGYATELVSVTPGGGREDSKLNFASSLNLGRDMTCYVGVSIEKDTLFNIAQSKSEEYGILPDAGDLYEIFGQILFNLNYSVSRNLRKSGLKLRHGAVRYQFPEWQDCVTTRCRLLNEYIDFSIMR